MICTQYNVHIDCAQNHMFTVIVHTVICAYCYVHNDVCTVIVHSDCAPHNDIQPRLVRPSQKLFGLYGPQSFSCLKTQINPCFFTIEELFSRQTIYLSNIYPGACKRHTDTWSVDAGEETLPGRHLTPFLRNNLTPFLQNNSKTVWHLSCKNKQTALNSTGQTHFAEQGDTSDTQAGVCCIWFKFQFEKSNIWLWT